MARPSTFVRTASRLLSAASLALLALTGAACEDAPERKEPATPAADPAEAAKIEQGKKLIAQANEAIGDKNYDKARKLLLKAAEIGVESQRFEIDEAMEKVDKSQAKLWANEVEDSFKNKDCAGAFKSLSEPLKTLAESEAFTRELRRLVGTDALKCLQDQIDNKVAAGLYADARKIAADPLVKTVLGDTTHGKLLAEIEATIQEALRAQLDGDLKARKWAQAAEKIDGFKKKGDATDEQVEALLVVVREGMEPEMSALAGKAVGQRDAPAALKQFDGMAKIAHWAISEPGVAALGSGLPEALAKKREMLAIWVEAQRLSFTALKKPEARFTHGKVMVFPPTHADAPSKLDVPHGAQIWILGTGKGKALITTADPGQSTLLQVLDKVSGWVAQDRLSKDPTIDWLVPDDQLKDQRVWGPLRPPDGMWELGTVSEVNGKDIVVKRLADGQPFKLTRQKLRSGRLSAGTKVLTFCTAKDQPAQVVEVPPPYRSAKLKCDGGQEKEEDLASLRSKPELLPPTK